MSGWVERLIEHFHPREVALFAELEKRVGDLEQKPAVIPQSLLNAVAQLDSRVGALERRGEDRDRTTGRSASEQDARAGENKGREEGKHD